MCDISSLRVKWLTAVPTVRSGKTQTLFLATMCSYSMICRRQETEDRDNSYVFIPEKSRHFSPLCPFPTIQTASKCCNVIF